MPENKDEQEQEGWNSPGPPVVETLRSQCRAWVPWVGSIPGWGSKIPHAVQCLPKQTNTQKEWEAYFEQLIT